MNGEIIIVGQYNQNGVFKIEKSGDDIEIIYSDSDTYISDILSIDDLKRIRAEISAMIGDNV